MRAREKGPEKCYPPMRVNTGISGKPKMKFAIRNDRRKHQ